MTPRRAKTRRKVYYHVTEATRVPAILIHGLIVNADPIFGRHLSGIFLASTLNGAFTAAEWTDAREPVILRVRVPETVPVYIDEVTRETCPEVEAVYVTSNISPSNIQVIGKARNWTQDLNRWYSVGTISEKEYNESCLPGG